MSTPAIDLAPTRSTHPGLALVLALLSLPGVTVAWDLPAGGLWIGLPLAAAALVLGAQARSAPAAARGARMATAAVVIATLAIGSMVVWAVASAVS
jgi:hypothetical protein